jgi:hypothetical protein
MTTAETEMSWTADEPTTARGALDRIRRTFAWKCGDLSTEELRATLAPSTLTLGGLLKHLAFLEDYYFTLRLDAEMPEPWASVDWDATPDWPWSSAAEDSAKELYALWEAAVARSRAAVRRALERGDLDQPVRYSEGKVTPTLRGTFADMVEEYARHTGHADLIRESIDGLVGEDPAPAG